MAKKRETAAQPIRLSVQSVEQVMVEPDDQDRFTMTAREAAHACKVADDLKQFEETFRLFLLDLHSWCNQHPEGIEAVCCSFSDCFKVAICTSRKEFDFVLDEGIAQLEIDIVKKYKWCLIEVSQMPLGTWDASSFTRNTIQIYGNGNRPPRKGKT